MCKQNQQIINKRETVNWTQLLSKAKDHPSLIDNQFLETKKKATIQFFFLFFSFFGMKTDLIQSCGHC